MENVGRVFDDVVGGKGLEHVVVVMLENRSFDNPLGYLDAHHPFDGLHFLPQHREADQKAQEDPRTPHVIRSDSYSNCTQDGERVWPEQLAEYFTPVDPPHAHIEIMEQLYGEGRVPTFPVATVDQEKVKPDMSGFLSWYKRRCGEWRYPHKLDDNEHHQVMHAYTPAQLPVLSALAREYAFSDAWFCSMPGPTAPNRQFLHSATSAGYVVNSGRPQHQPTLFDMLDAAKRSWKVYYHDIATVMTFSHAIAKHDFASHFSVFDKFEEDVRKEDFPAYTFIEPRIFDDPINGLYSNDQHPPHDVRRGEALLARIYEALRSSPHWESSLLMIMYDEHGGYYDHVPPPYIRTGPSAKSAPSGFDFSILGPRVPTVFVSPRIERRQPPVRPQSSSQYFTHESLVLTLAKIWGLDASILEWQHDPAHIATFEWLWQTADQSREVESHKEELRLPSWQELEAASVKFPHEGMDPYELNYEVKWVGWLIASARFLLDTIRVENPQVQQWCQDIIRLQETLSAGPFMDGFHKVIERVTRCLTDKVDARKREELKATSSFDLLPLLQYLDEVCA